MRTTLDIADDVLLAAKEVGKREKKSAGQVISEMARKGLQASTPMGGSKSEEFLGFRPLPSRGVVVTPELIERLREEEGV
ncbi:MAG: antitoxin [Fimbriimonas sp.]